MQAFQVKSRYNWVRSFYFKLPCISRIQIISSKKMVISFAGSTCWSRSSRLRLAWRVVLAVALVWKRPLAAPLAFFPSSCPSGSTIRTSMGSATNCQTTLWGSSSTTRPGSVSRQTEPSASTSSLTQGRNWIHYTKLSSQISISAFGPSIS